MIDEIFEMVMKEARARPGDNLKIKAYSVVSDVFNRVYRTFDLTPGDSCKSPSKDDKPA